MEYIDTNSDSSKCTNYFKSALFEKLGLSRFVVLRNRDIALRKACIVLCFHGHLVSVFAKPLIRGLSEKFVDTFS